MAATGTEKGRPALTTDRWRRLESLCHAALARPASERAAFLAEACRDDESLRQDAASLLESGDAASFLETPVGDAGAASSLVGRQLRAYRLDACIGAGGMGEVYRANDTRLGRDVAVKILPRAWAGDPQRRTRFEREARAVAALKHPNICTIHDVGYDEGIPFLVMELVEGESLATRLSRGSLPLDEALARAIEIADALDLAHRHGIVHRDLKPGNVMLARTGAGTSHAVQAKLLDFGLARMLPSDAGAPPGGTEATPTTRAGTVLGTLQYMAPEQVEGQPTDERTDIFAFGALLYEMVTARRAFEGTSTAALMAAIVRADAPPVLPRELGRIVRRCLEKDPLHRYQSARDLFNDLQEVKQDLDAGRLDTSDGRPGQRGRRVSRTAAAWLTAGTLAVLATAVYIGWFRVTARPTVRVERFQLQPPPGTEILPSGANSILAISPDGRWVAFRARGGEPDEPALYLRAIGEIEAKKIAPAGTVPFFSPDSRWLGFFADNGMYKVSVDGGRPQRICLVPNTLSQRGASWGDDETIVFSSNKALWRVRAAGGEPTVLTHPASSTRHYWPHVLPGSAAALFVINRGFNDRWRQIAVVSLKTGEVRTFASLFGTAPRLVSSGHLVYSHFGVLYAVPFDLARLDVVGEPIKVLDTVDTYAGAGSAAFDVSSSGSLVYVPGANRIADGQLVWLSRQGNAAPVVAERRPYVGGAIGPDGKRVCLAIADDLGETDLWVLDVEQRTWTRLTTGMAVWGTLAWSPDGKWIFFTSFKSGEAELFRMPSRGGSPDQLTADDTGWEYAGSVSPEGTTLLYVNTLQSQSDLMVLKLEPRGTPKPFINSPGLSERSPRFSPTGRLVAYESEESGSREIHVRPFPGPGDGLRVSPSGGVEPWWGRNDAELFYQRGPEIWSVAISDRGTLRHGEARVLFTADFLAQRAGGFLVPGERTGRFMAVRREQPKPITRQLVYAPSWLAELKQAFPRKRHAFLKMLAP